MKHILFFSLTVVFFLGCSPKREMVPNLVERYSTFEESESPIMVNGELFTGILFQEYTNGQIELEIRMKKGIPFEMVQNYEDGKVKIRGSYRSGKKNGLWEEFYDNGKLKSKGVYTDGKMFGLWEYFYSTGELLYKGEYRNNLKSGLWEGYHENGKILLRADFIEGTGKEERFHENGSISSTGNYIGGLEEGLWEGYDEDGSLSFRFNYKKGKFNGVYELYLNGKPLQIGTYKNGKEDGIIKYYLDGDFWYESLYIDGEKFY